VTGSGNEASLSPAPLLVIAHRLVGSGRSNTVGALCDNNGIARTYQNTPQHYCVLRRRKRTEARIKSEKISRGGEREREREEERKSRREKRREERRKKKKSVRKKTILPHLNRRE
jgi:hypothetical protein